MRSITFSPIAFDEYSDWAISNRDVFQKITSLIVEISRDPFKGRGKPEPLKGNYKGSWSRRITKEHRLVYEVNNDAIIITSCHGHYDD